MATGRPRRRGRGALVFVVIVLILAIVGLVVSGVLFGPAEALGATVSVVQSAMETRKGGAGFQTAIDGDLLASGDQVRTDANGRGFLTFFDGSTVEVEQGAQVTVQEVSRGADGAVAIRIEQTLGRAWINVQKFTNPNSRFEVKTPSQTAIVRGTALMITVQPDGTTIVENLLGDVIVRAQGVDRPLAPNQRATVVVGQQPGPAETIPPTPTLRVTNSPGTGVTVGRDGLLCGSGNATLPRCTEGSVVLGDIAAGEYVLLMTAAQAGNYAVTVELFLGQEVLGRHALQGSIERGDVLRTAITVPPDRRSLPAVAAFQRHGFGACGADIVGKIYSADNVADVVPVIRREAEQNRGAKVAVVFNSRQLTEAARRAIAQAKNLPVTFENINVTVGPGGMLLSGDATAGVKFEAKIELVAKAENDKLFILVKRTNLLKVLEDQLRPTLERGLSAVTGGVERYILVKRIGLRADCFSIVGETPK